MAKDELEKKVTVKFTVGEVATQTAPVIVDNTTNDTYTVELALAKIMNDLEVLKKLL